MNTNIKKILVLKGFIYVEREFLQGEGKIYIIVLEYFVK